MKMTSKGSTKKIAAKARINAEGVLVKFGPVVALNSFSARVPEGVVGLLGPNGAGKSTFIKAALGLVEPQAGTITIDGHDPRNETTVVRDLIGYMPEHECLIGSLTAVELVSYFGQISGMTGRDAIQRGHEVLDFIGIGEERYRKVEEYSTGMRQKVKLAQAIVHDPPILFLDEPTNGMDPQGREEMLKLITKIAKSGKTILVSSHILQEIERVSEHVIIINNGALVKEGGTKKLMEGSEEIFKVKVRGETAAIEAFVSEIKKHFKLSEKTDESGQYAIILKGKGDSGRIFETAMSTGVQVREFGPDTQTLEDVFLRAFSGGGGPGN